ncbi:hypothetical protein GE061_016028, partial [Apolygus lucorum]
GNLKNLNTCKEFVEPPEGCSEGRLCQKSANPEGGRTFQFGDDAPRRTPVDLRPRSAQTASHNTNSVRGIDRGVIEIGNRNFLVE